MDSISHTADCGLSCIQADSVQAQGHTLVSTVSEDICRSRKPDLV